jgi:hypothetical protein
VAARVLDIAAGLGLQRVERAAEDAPFDVSPVQLPVLPQSGGPQSGNGVAGSGSSSSSGGEGAASSSGGGGSQAEQLAAAEAAVAAQAAAVRALKDGGGSNQDPEVQSGVQVGWLEGSLLHRT